MIKNTFFFAISQSAIDNIVNYYIKDVSGNIYRFYSNSTAQLSVRQLNNFIRWFNFFLNITLVIVNLWKKVIWFVAKNQTLCIPIDSDYHMYYIYTSIARFKRFWIYIILIYAVMSLVLCRVKILKNCILRRIKTMTDVLQSWQIL